MKPRGRSSRTAEAYHPVTPSVNRGCGPEYFGSAGLLFITRTRALPMNLLLTRDVMYLLRGGREGALHRGEVSVQIHGFMLPTLGSSVC